MRTRLGKVPVIGRLFRTGTAVPVVRLAGVIGQVPFRGGGLSLKTLEAPLGQAFRMKAPAVVLAINSPGGSPVQSALIGRHVRRLAVKHDRRVLAFVEDIGASGGYWLAAAADEIFCDRASLVGSIGVVTSGFGAAEALAKLGIERRLFTAGKSKTLLDPFSPLREGDVAVLREIQTDLHDAFKDFIRERRAGRLKADEDELFNGRVWSGRQALDLGLVDAIADPHDVIAERFGKDARLTLVNRPRGWLQRRLRIEGEAAALASLLEERLHFARYGL
ncbi:MAG: S49 family peptidase [Geminicoccaceae bacterium]|nr:S49 family peptidase [Geminicoccaceae bacterium]